MSQCCSTIMILRVQSSLQVDVHIDICSRVDDVCIFVLTYCQFAQDHCCNASLSSFRVTCILFIVALCGGYINLLNKPLRCIMGY